MKKIALLSVLLVVIAVPSFAAPPNYVALKLGGYFPQHSDMDNFDSGFLAVHPLSETGGDG
ncbi:MAG TPA: hypothetical protein VK303_01675, partial [Desulfobacteria bacterium]|nr:hypothetical protein [Desulfobacteria bacterium]